MEDEQDKRELSEEEQRDLLLSVIGAMLSFTEDIDTHDVRVVERYESEILIVDTSRVSDGEKPFETAVSHFEYNEGKWIIVESYDTVSDARTGHQRWVETMTGEDLPDQLTDIANANIMKLADIIGVSRVYPRSRR